MQWLMAIAALHEFYINPGCISSMVAVRHRFNEWKQNRVYRLIESMTDAARVAPEKAGLTPGTALPHFLLIRARGKVFVMARSRNIKPGFFKNEVLPDASFQCRLLFIGLWTLADRAGRLEYRPRRIKGELFPYEECDVIECIETLERLGFLVTYTIKEIEYIQILNFERHQHPHKNEAHSTIPAPEQYGTSTIQAPDEHDTTRPDSLNPLTDSLNLKTELGEWFDQFWKQYPKKKSKGQAEKAWKKIKPDEQLFQQIMAGLERAKTSADWQKEDGKFIPYPATWLNAKGWEDEHTSGERSGEKVRYLA